MLPEWMHKTDLDLSLFTDEQRSLLERVKARAADNPQEEFSEKELNRLRFTRWLIEQGRLSDDC